MADFLQKYYSYLFTLKPHYVTTEGGRYVKVYFR